MSNPIKSFYKFLSSKYGKVYLEYKVEVKPRAGHGLPADELQLAVVNEHRNEYSGLLAAFEQFLPQIHQIKKTGIETDLNKPAWNNQFLPGLDIVVLYGMLAHFKPKQYIEVGSGNSTKVARLAITDQALDTKITSIDPFPRANIDHLADKVMRIPFENVKDYAFLIDSLNENDILFIDNSHRVFPNSDAMIFFLEVLPKLKKGVIVHIHDIYIPFDYPQFMCDRFYNEQYMLAAFLLANPKKYKTLMPNYFVSEDSELKQLTAPYWKHENLTGVEQHGGSFWLQINA
jgi:hypothetical protein